MNKRIQNVKSPLRPTIYSVYFTYSIKVYTQFKTLYFTRRDYPTPHQSLLQRFLFCKLPLDLVLFLGCNTTMSVTKKSRVIYIVSLVLGTSVGTEEGEYEVPFTFRWDVIEMELSQSSTSRRGVGVTMV